MKFSKRRQLIVDDVVDAAGWNLRVECFDNRVRAIGHVRHRKRRSRREDEVKPADFHDRSKTPVLSGTYDRAWTNDKKVSPRGLARLYDQSLLSDFCNRESVSFLRRWLNWNRLG